MSLILSPRFCAVLVVTSSMFLLGDDGNDMLTMYRGEGTKSRFHIVVLFRFVYWSSDTNGLHTYLLPVEHH